MGESLLAYGGTVFVGAGSGDLGEFTEGGVGIAVGFGETPLW